MKLVESPMSSNATDQQNRYVSAVMVLWEAIQLRLQGVSPTNLALLSEILEDAGNDFLNISDEIREIIITHDPSAYRD